MLLKIWNEQTIYSEDKNDQLYLKLILSESNDILLSVVDKSGNKIDDGLILFIDNTYKCIIIYHSLNQKIPLSLEPASHEPVIYKDLEIRNKIEVLKKHSMAIDLLNDIKNIKMQMDLKKSQENSKH